MLNIQKYRTSRASKDPKIYKNISPGLKLFIQYSMAYLYKYRPYYFDTYEELTFEDYVDIFQEASGCDIITMQKVFDCTYPDNKMKQESQLEEQEQSSS